MHQLQTFLLDGCSRFLNSQLSHFRHHSVAESVGQQQHEWEFLRAIPVNSKGSFIKVFRDDNSIQVLSRTRKQGGCHQRPSRDKELLNVIRIQFEFSVLNEQSDGDDEPNHRTRNQSEHSLFQSVSQGNWTSNTRQLKAECNYSVQC